MARAEWNDVVTMVKPSYDSAILIIIDDGLSHYLVSSIAKNQFCFCCIHTSAFRGEKKYAILFSAWNAVSTAV